VGVRYSGLKWEWEIRYIGKKKKEKDGRLQDRAQKYGPI